MNKSLSNLKIIIF